MTMKCRKCNGTGRTPLYPALREVLTVLEKLGPLKIPEIYEALPSRNTICATAVNRRVERLVKMKLVKKVAKLGVARYQVV